MAVCTLPGHGWSSSAFSLVLWPQLQVKLQVKVMVSNLKLITSENGRKNQEYNQQRHFYRTFTLRLTSFEAIEEVMNYTCKNNCQRLCHQLTSLATKQVARLSILHKNESPSFRLRYHYF